MIDGWIAWDQESSYTFDSDEELECWKNCLHEVSTLFYNMMMKSLCCVSLEVGNLPYAHTMVGYAKGQL